MITKTGKVYGYSTPKRRPELSDVRMFESEAEAKRAREAYKGSGRKTEYHVRNVKCGGYTFACHVLIIFAPEQ